MPYTWGTIGVIYNKTVVDEEDIGGWDLLFGFEHKVDEHFRALLFPGAFGNDKRIMLICIAVSVGLNISRSYRKKRYGK